MSEKWSNLQSGIEYQKAERRTAIEERLQMIEDAINKERPSDEMKFKVLHLITNLQMLKEQIAKLHEIISSEFQCKEVFSSFSCFIVF